MKYLGFLFYFSIYLFYSLFYFKGFPQISIEPNGFFTLKL